MSLYISNFHLKIDSKFTQINYFQFKTNQICINFSQVFDLMKESQINRVST